MRKDQPHRTRPPIQYRFLPEQASKITYFEATTVRTGVARSDVLVRITSHRVSSRMHYTKSLLMQLNHPHSMFHLANAHHAIHPNRPSEGTQARALVQRNLEARGRQSTYLSAPPRLFLGLACLRWLGSDPQNGETAPATDRMLPLNPPSAHAAPVSYPPRSPQTPAERAFR